MILAMQVALQDVAISHNCYAQAQELHAELEEHTQHFRTQRQKNMGCEILQFQLKPAYKQDRIKLEAIIVANTKLANQICNLFVSDDGYELKGVEPKGN